MLGTGAHTQLGSATTQPGGEVGGEVGEEIGEEIGEEDDRILTLVSRVGEAVGSGRRGR